MLNMNNYPYTGKRVAATLIDYTFVWSLTIFYIVYFGKEETRGQYTIHGFSILLLICFWLLYFVVAEALGGTLGHRIFYLKVVAIDGLEPDFGSILVRRIFDIFEIVWCFGFIAFLVVRNTRYHQRLGDIVAKTYVIGRNDKLNLVVFDFEEAAF